jgi:hypothetical protein
MNCDKSASDEWDHVRERFAPKKRQHPARYGHSHQHDEEKQAPH